MVTPTLINGNSSAQLDTNDRPGSIAAGRVIFFNRSTSGQQVIVTKNGAEPISLGGGELEVQMQAESNGKTQITYYQDPHNPHPLKNLTLVLEASGNADPQRIELDFSNKFKIDDNADSNTLAAKKIIPNSFQKVVSIPPGIYSVRAAAANTKVKDKPADEPQIISFKAPNPRAALEELARQQLPLNPLKKAG
jgi:hypothetical protein